MNLAMATGALIGLFRILNLGIRSCDQYSFDIAEQSSFQDDKDFGGYAEIDDDGGKAVFMLDAESNITLPKTPIFPCNNSAIINKAGDGGKFWGHRCSLVLNQMMPC
ncbi:MAG: hypothetical protein CM15mP46_7120 [Alphaproteobacteria bacterium]|nr:MAG: hypothetical protein CM15mP46_7120 [Alphaproteobacteria bacterium]